MARSLPLIARDRPMVHPENENRDPGLMARLRHGDVEALGVLVSRHEGTLLGLFRHLGLDAHSAEDCAQDTFLRVWEYRDRYRPVRPFRAFLLTLARRAWIDHQRRRSRSVPAHDPSTFEARAAETIPEARLDVRDAIDALPDRLRWVVVLSVNEGLGYAEIAEILGIPVGTVKSRMHHAMRGLRERLHAWIEV